MAVDTMSDPAIETLSKDVLEMASLANQVKSALKDPNRAQLLGALLPTVISTVEKDAADIAKALPEIKAGWKTTEFWLSLALIIINVGLAAATGKPMPFDANASLVTLVGAYATSRTFIKR